MIGIINYGLGNIEAFANIFKRLNIDVRIVDRNVDLKDINKIILPGVGAFDWAMTRLNESGLRKRLDELVIKQNVPALGVCVGMQMMAQRSEEGKLDGLNWINGEVRRFDATNDNQKAQIPHMGWNNVSPCTGDGIFAGLESDARFYFLHSFYFSPANECKVLASTDYNGIFASSVCFENAYGVQFHPEKSHHWGVRLLENFARL